MEKQTEQGVSTHGWGTTQGGVMSLLGTPEGKAVRLSEVADTLGVTNPTASATVALLVRKKLVVKRPAHDDQRAIALRLTAEGRREADRIADWPDSLLPAVDALTHEEQTVFLRAVTTIIRNFQDSGVISPARMCVTCRYFRPNVYRNEKTAHHCAFVDAPFGDRHLRLDCPEHEQADDTLQQANWETFRTQSA